MALCIKTDPCRDVAPPMATTAGTGLGKLIADAVMHHRAGRLGEAEAAYLAVLSVAPGHPGTLHNLGVIAGACGKPQAAIARFDAVIAAAPDYAAAHYNRAVACHALGRTREAISGMSRACAIDPAHYDAHRALGFLWLAQRERDRALDHFARTYDLRRGEDRTGIAAASLNHATRDKLLHDAEQFRFLVQSLAARRHDGQRFAILANAYEEVAKEIGPDPHALSTRQLELLGEYYNTAIHVSAAPACAKSVIGERADRDAIVHAFAAPYPLPHAARNPDGAKRNPGPDFRRLLSCDGDPGLRFAPSGLRAREGGVGGAVWFDDLLTPAALTRLKKFLLESTVWHDFSHIGGFVASYLEDGLASPLLLQIADELRNAFPEILGPHPLSQAWAFKSLDANAAIEAHADDGAISVNFWVTPDAANLRPGSGGLAVCRVPPPADWSLTSYHADKDRIAAFLEQNAGDMLIVPYRENRAVMFESRLFHWSDAPHFSPGYENRRINVTLLFGSARQRSF
jgi:tetratricopeptide (TPR) repeat protein